jgi:uncharacterized membrane protein YgcG
MQKHGLHYLRAIPLFVALLLAMVAVMFVLGSKSVGAQTLAGDPPIPHITQADRGWVDTMGSVDSKTLESLRQVSDRVTSEGFQLAGVFFSDISSDPSQFASDVGNQNGIGSSNNDNGLLILVLLDRAGTDGNTPYIFVAPGRGLEGLLNDAKMTRFREASFNPLRAQGKWQEGLIELSSKFADYLKTPDAQEFSDQGLAQTANNANPQFDFSKLPVFWQCFWCLVGLIVLALFVLFIIAVIRSPGGPSGGSGWSSGSSSSSSSSSSWDGGSFGAGGSFGGGGSGG